MGESISLLETVNVSLESFENLPQNGYLIWLGIHIKIKHWEFESRRIEWLAFEI